MRHRIKDDILMMKKAKEGGKPYEKYSSDFMYVIYKAGDKLLTEPVRLEQIKEFLYTSPEVQRICIIKKADIENGSYELNWGWAVKYEHIEKYNLMTNQYAHRYESKLSIMKFAECENVMPEVLLKDTMDYMKKNRMEISDDVISIFVAKTNESGVATQYMLISVPVKKSVE